MAKARIDGDDSSGAMLRRRVWYRHAVVVTNAMLLCWLGCVYCVCTRRDVGDCRSSPGYDMCSSNSKLQ